MTTGIEKAALLEARREVRKTGDGGPPMQVQVGDLAGELHTMKSAGYTYLWKRDDRDRSVFNDNALASKMEERFPIDHPTMAGEFAWTATEPLEPAARGTTLCLLHPRRPERPDYDTKGYPVCDTSHFINEYDAELHLRAKHRQTYDMIMRGKDQARSDEAAQANTDVMTMLANAIAGNAITIPPQPRAEAPFTEDTTSVDAGSIWDYTGVTGTADPVTVVSDHVHRYGKAMGAQCKQSGCESVRVTPFTRRKRK